MSGPTRMHPEDLAELVDLVAERLAAHLGDRLEQEAAPPTTTMLNAVQVAECYGVTAEWARAHADELGAVRLGDGPRPRLRFDPAKVAAALSPHEGSKGSQATYSPRRRRKSPDHRQVTASGCPLLPIAGPEGVE